MNGLFQFFGGRKATFVIVAIICVGALTAFDKITTGHSWVERGRGAISDTARPRVLVFAHMWLASARSEHGATSEKGDVTSRREGGWQQLNNCCRAPFLARTTVHTPCRGAVTCVYSSDVIYISAYEHTTLSIQTPQAYV